MEKCFPIGISRIAEILCLGCLSTASPHPNAEVTQHGRSPSSITTSLLTSGLTGRQHPLLRGHPWSQITKGC